MEKEGGSQDTMGRLSCLPSTVLQKLVASQTVLSRPLACRHLPCRHPQDLSASTQDALGVHPQIYPNRQMSQSELKRPPRPTPSCSTHSLFADEKTEASRNLQPVRPGGTGSSTVFSFSLLYSSIPSSDGTTCLPHQFLPPRRIQPHNRHDRP